MATWPATAGPDLGPCRSHAALVCGLEGLSCFSPPALRGRPLRQAPPSPDPHSPPPGAAFLTTPEASEAPGEEDSAVAPRSVPGCADPGPHTALLWLLGSGWLTAPGTPSTAWHLVLLMQPLLRPRMSPGQESPPHCSLRPVSGARWLCFQTFGSPGLSVLRPGRLAARLDTSLGGQPRGLRATCEAEPPGQAACADFCFFVD